MGGFQESISSIKNPLFQYKGRGYGVVAEIRGGEKGSVWRRYLKKGVVLFWEKTSSFGSVDQKILWRREGSSSGGGSYEPGAVGCHSLLHRRAKMRGRGKNRLGRRQEMCVHGDVLNTIRAKSMPWWGRRKKEWAFFSNKKVNRLGSP